MNKIFKVVWNKARGCYMAVCEYAKSQTKSCSTAKLFANKRAVALGMAAVLTMGFVGDASAEIQTYTTYKDTEKTIIDSVKTYDNNVLLSVDTYNYDSANRIDNIVKTDTNGNEIGKEKYTYNTNGTIKNIVKTDIDGKPVFTDTYAYNTDGTLKTITTKDNLLNKNLYVDTYAYTDGVLSSITTKDSILAKNVSVKSYDEAGNLSTITNYTYDSAKVLVNTETLNAKGDVTDLQYNKAINFTTAGDVTTGNLNVGTLAKPKDLKVYGNVTVGDPTKKKNLTVNGTTALNGNTTVTGTTTLNGNTNVNGTLTVGSKDVNKNLVVNGNVTANTIRVNSHMIHTEGGSIVNESSNNMSFIINGAMSTINGDSNTILSGSYSSIGGKDNSKETSVNYSTLINTNLVRLEQPFSTIMSSDRVIVTGKNLDKDGNLLAGHSVALAACHTNIKEYYGATITSKNVEAAGYNSTVIGSFGTGYKNEAGDYDFFNIKASGKHSTIIGASAYTGLRDRTEESKEASEASGSVEAVGEYSTILGASANDGMDITAGTTENGYAVILGAEADEDNVAATGSHSSLINIKDSSATGDYSTVIGSSNVKTEAKYSAIIASDPVEIKAGSDFSVILGSEGVAEGDSATTYINGTHGLIAGSKDSAIDGNYGVVIGGNNSKVTKNYGLAFGANTEVAVEGGVALGAGSKATVDKDVVGANPLKADTTKNPNAWKSTAAAVAVGGVQEDGTVITRQITGVAAGYNDTDAVNVAQLNAVIDNLGDGNTYGFAYNDAVGVGTGTGAIDISENGTNKWQIIAGEGVSIYQNTENQFIIKTSGGGSVDPIEPGDVKMGFEGDVGDVGEGKRPEVAGGQYLNIKGGATEFIEHPNIAVVGDKYSGTLNLRLAKDVNLKDGSLTLSKDGKTVTIEGDNVDMGGNQIHNVEAGKDKKDAVNVEQMEKYVAEHGGGDMTEINNKINKINNNVNKVGARAAALAALHPMDFDPDDKLNFAVGYGHYKGENAGAIGAFYRPDEKVMFSVGGTVAEHDTMINAGISFSLDRTARQTNTKTAMARDIIDLKAENAEMKAQIQQLINQNNMFLNAINQITGNQGKPLDTSKIVMFPDVPSTHWAYEYIEGLQKLGIIEGYPNGNFSGDRSCTRYEFAAMLFRALKAGQVIPEALANEFKAELGRFRVDRIAGEDNDAKKIERIRVNGGDDRDHYGTKMVAAK